MQCWGNIYFSILTRPASCHSLWYFEHRRTSVCRKRVIFTDLMAVFGTKFESRRNEKDWSGWSLVLNEQNYVIWEVHSQHLQCQSSLWNVQKMATLIADSNDVTRSYFCHILWNMMHLVQNGNAVKSEMEFWLSRNIK